ncbi:MAG: CRISPR-associated endonuclease Cas2 [Candidatus Doudnabacteria bacterium]|nr:CRISPR-associated endonuclease Cas2 [Candidatus Doudnabacteria bacterium]
MATRGIFLSEFLTAVGDATGFFEWPLQHSEGWRREQLSGVRHKYYQVVYQAKKRGLVRELSKDGRKFLQLTAKGELQKLVMSMNVIKQPRWDGKWRLVVFDIPEDARHKRDSLRWLLKKHGFKKLQASVFISPYSLNREAIIFLNRSGLMPYIRILKIEEMDNDLDLKKIFNLS